jgi:hypothetical protein
MFFTYLKDFTFLAKHWLICYQKQQRVFYDLKGYLKLKGLWFWVFWHLKKLQDYSFISKRIIITENESFKIINLLKVVLNGEYIWKGNSSNKKKNYLNTSDSLPLNSDCIVQEILRILLEPIWDVSFQENSHGFRPERGYFTALLDLKRHFTKSIWFIKGHIKTYYDLIDFEILFKYIKQRVRDPIVLKLLITGYHSNIFFIRARIRRVPLLGIVSGELLDFFLINIYFHFFDLYIEQLKIKYNQLTVLGSCNKERILLNSITYVRHSGSFLIGFIGSYRLVWRIKSQIIKILRKQMFLLFNERDIKIVHANKGIYFLGYWFKRFCKFNNISVKRNILSINLHLIQQELIMLGFCNKQGKPLPLFSCFKKSQLEINLLVNSILRSLFIWWQLAVNYRRALAYVSYIIRYAIAKLYAAKFKLGTVAKVFKISRNNLSSIVNTKQKLVINQKYLFYSKLKNFKVIPGLLFDRYYKIPRICRNNLQIDYNFWLHKGQIKMFIIFLQSNTNRYKEKSFILSLLCKLREISGIRKLCNR